MIHLILDYKQFVSTVSLFALNLNLDFNLNVNLDLSLNVLKVSRVFCSIPAWQNSYRESRRRTMRESETKTEPEVETAAAAETRRARERHEIRRTTTRLMRVRRIKMKMSKRMTSTAFL